MKTLDFSLYEKLKINPISLKEFDNIKTKYEYDITVFDCKVISEFDIIETRCHEYFIAIMQDTDLSFVKNNTPMFEIKKIVDGRDDDIFVRRLNGETGTLSIFTYNEGPKNEWSHHYDIIKLWKATQTMKNVITTHSSFDDAILKEWINKFKYILIYDENN